MRIILIVGIVAVGFCQKPFEKRLFELIEGVEISMVWIPAGTFLMGSPMDEIGRKADLEAQHKVNLTTGFWIAESETTQDIWQAVMKANPSKLKHGKYPVESVSYYDVMHFIKKIHPKFRLPTEAEWEYACRAGSNSAYAGIRDEMTWHRNNSNRTTHQVATKKANAWGLYDMHGNVGEWVSDWLSPFSTEEQTDPVGAETGERKLIKGGQYTGRVRHTRAADRQSGMPEDVFFFTGFRLVREK